MSVALCTQYIDCDNKHESAESLFRRLIYEDENGNLGIKICDENASDSSQVFSDTYNLTAGDNPITHSMGVEARILSAMQLSGGAWRNVDVEWRVDPTDELNQIIVTVAGNENNIKINLIGW